MIVPSFVLGQRAGAVAPSDKILFGGIGIGSRGAHVLSKLLKIEQAKFIAICDVRNERREGFEGGKSSGGGGGGGGSRPAPSNNSPAGYDDEEPF